MVGVFFFFCFGEEDFDALSERISGGVGSIVRCERRKEAGGELRAVVICCSSVGGGGGVSCDGNGDGIFRKSFKK